MPANYALITRIKTLLDINHNDDDTLLANLILIANQSLEHTLQPWADTLPLDTSDTDLQAIADFEVVANYKLAMKELEAYKAWNDMRNEKINHQIKKLKSDYNSRTKTVSRTNEYLTSPLKDASTTELGE